MWSRLRRRLRLRTASWLPLAWWTWKYRAELRRALALLKSAPRRIREGRVGDVVTEAKVLRALATDDRTRGAPGIELTGVRDGVAHLRVSGATDPSVVVDAVNGTAMVAVHTRPA